MTLDKAINICCKYVKRSLPSDKGRIARPCIVVIRLRGGKRRSNEALSRAFRVDICLEVLPGDVFLLLDPGSCGRVALRDRAVGSQRHGSSAKERQYNSCGMHSYVEKGSQESRSAVLVGSELQPTNVALYLYEVIAFWRSLAR